MSETFYFRIFTGFILVLYGSILFIGYQLGNVPDSDLNLLLVFPAIPLFFLFVGPFRNKYVKGMSVGTLFGLLIASIIMLFLIYYTSHEDHSDDRFAWLFLLSQVYLFLPGLLAGAISGAVITFFLSFKKESKE